MGDWILFKKTRERENVNACTLKRERKKEVERKFEEEERVFLIAISRDGIVTSLIVICAYKASEIKEF